MCKWTSDFLDNYWFFLYLYKRISLPLNTSRWLREWAPCEHEILRSNNASWRIICLLFDEFVTVKVEFVQFGQNVQDDRGWNVCVCVCAHQSGKSSQLKCLIDTEFVMKQIAFRRRDSQNRKLMKPPTDFCPGYLFPEMPTTYARFLTLVLSISDILIMFRISLWRKSRLNS